MRKLFMAMAVIFLSAAIFTSCKKDKDSESSVELTSITISDTVATIEAGETLQLSYNVLPKGAKVESAVWSSSAEDVATVDQNGLVTAIEDGTATLVITINDCYTAICLVTVTTTIKRQWTCLVSGSNCQTIDLSTPNQITFASSTDNTNFYIDGTYPVTEIVYSDEDKTAGTITYEMSGTKTLAFNNLSYATVHIESLEESDTFNMYGRTKYKLQQR